MSDEPLTTEELTRIISLAEYWGKKSNDNAPGAGDDLLVIAGKLKKMAAADWRSTSGAAVGRGSRKKSRQQRRE